MPKTSLTIAERVSNKCLQIQNAYNDYFSYSSHKKVKIASMILSFGLIPLIVSIAYLASSLIGRVTKKKDLSSTDEKTEKAADSVLQQTEKTKQELPQDIQDLLAYIQKVHNSVYSSSIYLKVCLKSTSKPIYLAYDQHDGTTLKGTGYENSRCYSLTSSGRDINKKIKLNDISSMQLIPNIGQRYCPQAKQAWYHMRQHQVDVSYANCIQIPSNLTYKYTLPEIPTSYSYPPKPIFHKVEIFDKESGELLFTISWNNLDKDNFDIIDHIKQKREKNFFDYLEYATALTEKVPLYLRIYLKNDPSSPKYVILKRFSKEDSLIKGTQHSKANFSLPGCEISTIQINLNDISSMELIPRIGNRNPKEPDVWEGIKQSHGISISNRIFYFPETLRYEYLPPEIPKELGESTSSSPKIFHEVKIFDQKSSQLLFTISWIEDENTFDIIYP